MSRPEHSGRFSPRPRPRRGVLALGLVIVLPVLMITMGLVLELALIGYVREQLQSAADAAALAGAAELLDEDRLKPDATPNIEDDAQAAQRFAALFCNYNLGLGQPWITFSDKPCLVGFGHVANPTDRSSPFESWDGVSDINQIDINTLQVYVERSRRFGNQVPLRLAPFFGVVEARIGVQAAATVDRRVYGFRPKNGAPIFVAPLTITQSGLPQAWLEQANAAAVAGANDNFTVDPSTDTVTPGPDGIPEIRVTAPLPNGDPPDATDTLGTLLFGFSGSDPGGIANQLRVGLEPIDLYELDGQLALDENNLLQLNGRTDVDADVVVVLQEIIGKKRIWPLSSIRPDLGQTGVVYDVTDFAAGRVVDASNGPAGKLTVVIQPATMPTTTALVRDGQPLNPYLAKLYLTR